MTRLEKIGTTGVAAEKKDEIVESYADASTGLKKHGSCLKFFFGMLFLFVFACVWIVAATGLVFVPGVSLFAFHAPTPVRTVVPTSSAEVYATHVFTSLVETRWKAGGGNLTDRSVDITIPESVLTASAQSFLRESGADHFFQTDRVQIAILPNNQMELFLPILGTKTATALFVRMQLIAKEGRFDLELAHIQLGSLVLPNALVSVLIQPFVNRALSTLNTSLSSYMRVDSLFTQDGSIHAKGKLTVEVKPAL